MRTIKRRWILIAVAAVLAVAGLVALLLHPRPPLAECRLDDDTVLRLERLTFGKRESFKPGGVFRQGVEAVAGVLPRRWATKLAPEGTNPATWSLNYFPARTNEPALQVWLTRRDARTGAYQDVDVQGATVADDDGCVFKYTAGGGEYRSLLPSAPPTPPVWPGMTNSNGVPLFSALPGVKTSRSSSVWFIFETFPRRSKELKLRFYDYNGKLVGEFTVPNPAPPPPPVDWKVQSLPAAATNGNLVFAVTRVELQTNYRPIIAFSAPVPPVIEGRSPLFSFEVQEKGVLSKDWDPISMDLSDSSGNVVPKTGDPRAPLSVALCPEDPAWKLQVKFVARAGSPTASNATWTLRGIKVPAVATLTALNTNTVLDGVSIKVASVSGQGSTVYSNGAPVSIAPVATGRGSGLMTGNSRFRFTNQSYTLDSALPHVAVIVDGLKEGQHISLRVTDDQGSQFHGRPNPVGAMPLNSLRGGFGGLSTNDIFYYRGGERGPWAGKIPNNVVFFQLDHLATNAQTMDLMFSVHNLVTEEFIFKPQSTSGATHENH